MLSTINRDVLINTIWKWLFCPWWVIQMSVLSAVQLGLWLNIVISSKPLLLTCIAFSCPVLLACPTVLSSIPTVLPWGSYLLSCLTLPSYLNILLSFPTVLSYSPVLLSCPTVLSYCPIILSCPHDHGKNTVPTLIVGNPEKLTQVFTFTTLGTWFRMTHSGTKFPML